VAWGVNDLGQAVGASEISTGSCRFVDGSAQAEYHAVLWDRGAIHDLHANGCYATAAYGINNSGQIVGRIDQCVNDDFYYGEVCFAVSAFVYSHGVMADLNNLAPGFGFVSAYGINDVGQIVANSRNAAYLLSPGQQCTSPDPFAAVGGGTCFNDGWLPPGMPVPSPVPAPPPLPPSPPPPGPPPTPTPGTCTAPDPFVSLGGGTCYNGGWLPPGVAPPPSPAPAPTPGPGTCTTPDPFVSLGGGTCFNGGWLPPGLPPLASGSGSL
jgi:hypothetical protein